MENYTMVKTEVQPNGDIFLYYVDENGAPIDNTDGVINTIDQEQLQQLQENYVLEEISEQEYVENDETEQPKPNEESLSKERWLDEETEKLVIFYVDNKEAFQNPAMKKKHLWTVACKTMLVGKNPPSCEMKLRNLKRKYLLLHIDHLKNNNNPKVWPFYDICHQAFHDDNYVQAMLKENGLIRENAAINIATGKPEVDSNVAVKKLNKSPDEKVMYMLQLYLHYKKEGVNDYLWQKKVWEKIAVQIGEDAEFWHKRFLNYKQHYIRMHEKRKESSTQVSPPKIIWPYMALFDEIYKDDAEFKRKYGSPKECMPEEQPPVTVTSLDWNETEKTVLVKYYFDCLDEFQDPTIPNSFLWNEIGRLLDKKPEECREKYEQLRKEHLELYTAGGYNIKIRKPVAILFDNIISQETEKIFYQPSSQSAADLQWGMEKIDEMVQFLFDNIETFKDPICHFVCWAAVAAKLQESIAACKEQWHDLTTLYKTILNDKKEDPDLQIDWRYIDIFDRIFDYGMDTKLLEGYANKPRIQPKTKKIVQKNKPRASTEDVIPDNLSDLEADEFDDKSSGKRSRGTGDPKQIRILEYYLKYKDKFATTQRRKYALWEGLAINLGISAEQCAHRFRNLKQVYMAYIQREIDKPDKPILWPYFALCKKVFGYRAIKNKLKHGKMDIPEQEEWTPKEIKLLINYFGQNFKEIDPNPEDTSKWTSIAKDMNKSEAACRDKFLDLTKSYRKIITMMSRNPECKINWKYFKFFEAIYSNVPTEGMEVDSADENATMSLTLPHNAIKTEIQDDDLQCIIVIPEGEEAKTMNNAQIIINQPHKPTEPRSEARIPWTRKDKISLLKHVLEYIKANEGEIIDTKVMWTAIAEKLNRQIASCRKMYFLIKTKHKNLKNSGKTSVIKGSAVLKIMDQILAAKPKFTRPPLIDEEHALKEQTVYTDVALPLWKVEKALKYYLEHVEEFVNPRYDSKIAWVNLAQAVPILLKKIFTKINYLKQFFDSETNEVKGEKFEFADLLKEILEKEFICKVAMGNVPEPMNTEDDTETTVWTDDETEQLLSWYLANLDKFKNPIYVPSYLWMEAAGVLSKSAVACSKKMTEIRSQYSAMAKENPEALNSWRFYELCQKIYGTGKKNAEEQQ